MNVCATRLLLWQKQTNNSKNNEKNTNRKQVLHVYLNIYVCVKEVCCQNCPPSGRENVCFCCSISLSHTNNTILNTVMEFKQSSITNSMNMYVVLWNTLRFCCGNWKEFQPKQYKYVCGFMKYRLWYYCKTCCFGINLNGSFTINRYK